MRFAIRFLRPTLAILLLACVAAAPATRPTTQPRTQFIRFVEEADGRARLETAIATYRNAEGVIVDLIGAVHVAEKPYFAELNQRFADYDALLYEMVKARDMPAPQPGAQGGGSVGALQRFLRDVLELQFQLDAIDYTQANFIHADLDAETFFKMQKKRGESIWGLMFDTMLDEMFRQMAGTATTQPTLPELLGALSGGPDRARHTKVMFARSFDQLEAKLKGFENTVLVTERNKAAFKVLDQSIKDGKKKIGIFYGAAHLQDMDKRLLAMGFERTGIEWLTAWDMPAPPPISTTQPAAP